MEYLSRGGGIHHLSGTFFHTGGVHHLSGIFILRGGVHHLSGISIQRGGRTPPQWNIFPQGGGHTTSVEYLSTWGGGHHLNGIFIQRVGVHHLSGIFIQRGGYTTSVEYLCRRGVHSNSVEYLSTSGGGGTPPRWNIYPEGGVYHLSGIFIQRGGGYTTSMEYFSRPPIFPNAPFFHPFFSLGGTVPLCCMVSHSSQLSIFMMVFFLVAVLRGGGVADFSLSLSEMKEGREGSGTTLLSDFC